MPGELEVMPVAGVEIELGCWTTFIPLIAALIGVSGVLWTLWVNGDRAERQRRRELHSRALAAVVQYGEMPFMIRRRRHEPEHRSAERVRLSDHFSQVKAEIATCQVLLAADGDQKISAAFDDLVESARGVVGREAHEAWKEEPVERDSEMNMGPLFDRVQDFRMRLEEFESHLSRATLPRRKRVSRWLRKKVPWKRRGAKSSA